MIALHAKFPIDPDQREAALEVFERLVDGSRTQPGIEYYHAATDLHDPDVVHLVERYEDEDAFDAQLETDHFAEFDEALPGLLAGEPEAIRYDVESATELDL
jgi:quinol monooxygenase YgiN